MRRAPVRYRRLLVLAEAASRIVAYLYIGASGVAVILDRPSTYDGAGEILTVLWGVFQLAGFVLALSVALRKPFLEWATVMIGASGVLCYGVLSLMQVILDGSDHFPRYAIISALFFLMVSRFFAQWVRVVDRRVAAEASRE